MSDPVLPDPWAQQPGEPSQAFDAFKSFRDAGASRSLDNSYRQHQAAAGRERGARAPGQWRTWAKEFNWRTRALQFDARGERVAQMARERVIETQAEDWQRLQLVQKEREGELLGKLFGKLQAMLEFGLAREMTRGGDGSITVFEPIKWDFGHLIQGLKLFSTIGRVHCQLPTQVQKDETGAQDFESLFIESGGQLADVMPAGAFPPMPDDPAQRPSATGATTARSAKGLLQPSKALRPEFGQDITAGIEGEE